MAKEFNFVETDSRSLYDTILDNIMNYVGEPLYPGDERRIFAEAVIQLLVSFYNLINDTAKQKMLQYARGDVLDAIGEMENTPRLLPEPAHCTVRFTASEGVTANIVIPKGTRVTPDGEIYFETETAKVLQTGEPHIDIEVICQTAGSEFNGIEIGKINVLVDVIPYISSVSNINKTTGGDDGEPYTEEGDNRYRERIRLSKASYSVAGPVEAYRYFALSASPDISDVLIDSPAGNIVDIYALMKGGEIPSEEILEEIEAKVSADDVRPMTDKVTAKAPTQVDYDIEIKYYSTLDNEPQAVLTVESAGGAIDKYNAWQTGALGRDINPDYLRKFALAPDDGTNAVSRIDVVKPIVAEIKNNQVAKFSGNLKVTHAVIAG